MAPRGRPRPQSLRRPDRLRSPIRRCHRSRVQRRQNRHEWKAGWPAARRRHHHRRRHQTLVQTYKRRQSCRFRHHPRIPDAAWKRPAGHWMRSARSNRHRRPSTLNWMRRPGPLRRRSPRRCHSPRALRLRRNRWSGSRLGRPSIRHRLRQLVRCRRPPRHQSSRLASTRRNRSIPERHSLRRQQRTQTEPREGSRSHHHLLRCTTQ